MKKWLLFLLPCMNIISKIKAQTNFYDGIAFYKGSDLGLSYTPQQSTFRIWSPLAQQAQLLIYTENKEGIQPDTIPMMLGAEGVLSAAYKGDHKGKFYTFRVKSNGQWLNEVPDPYAKAVGANGKRAQVIDLEETNPLGWEKDRSPVFKNKTDAIIYELHIRDASIAANSGINAKGKFLGLTERGTKNKEGLSTGLDHIKELGVTHVHLLPVFDFNSVDETADNSKYNWGYDPLNYNTPEGSYSTNHNDGMTRIKEFKQMVKTFHENGLSVVMDVVYNHTALTETSHFNQLVPGYYYRQTQDGKFSNATACGNETASERPMVRKFILESMLYWVKEYHIDGFRIDLMGVHDIETINLISKELHKIKPGILLYGEGWTAGASPLPDAVRAIKKNAYKLDRVAVFSDDIRDGIKGNVFEHEDRGFASGKPSMEESIKFGVVASVKHPQVDYSKVNYSHAPYATQPYQTITYAECHDNHVLWDKLAISAKDASEEERVNMHKLALSIVLTSQGISFLHAGTEFLRSKKGVENSFESPDSINAIDWSLKTKNKEVVEYVKGLIQLRKDHPAFRMINAKQIVKNVRFLDKMPEAVIVYTINGNAVKDPWKKILVVLNGKANQKRISLPPGQWKTAVADNYVINKNNTLNSTVENFFIPKDYSCSVFYQ